MRKMIVLSLLLLPSLSWSALPGRKDTNHAGLNLQQLFQKIDVKLADTTVLDGNIKVDTYTYKINKIFEKDLNSYRRLHWHLRHWCEQNKGIWKSDFDSHMRAYGRPQAEADVFPSLTLKSYESFANVSCQGVHANMVAFSFNAREIYVTEQQDLLMQTRKRLVDEKKQAEAAKEAALKQCLKIPNQEMEKIEVCMVSAWRQGLKVGDTIDGINLVIGIKNKDLLEIQNRSSGQIYWFKRSELNQSEQLRSAIDDAQKPYRKMAEDCRRKF